MLKKATQFLVSTFNVVLSIFGKIVLGTVLAVLATLAVIAASATVLVHVIS